MDGYCKRCPDELKSVSVKFMPFIKSVDELDFVTNITYIESLSTLHVATFRCDKRKQFWILKVLKKSSQM